MEAVFQSIEAGQVSELVSQKVRELERERTDMVAGEIAKLQGLLGARFAVIGQLMGASRPVAKRVPQKRLPQ